MAETTGIGNTFVARLLTSPAHRVLSRAVCLIDYEGRRSGRRYATPTQYARGDGDTVVIFVGKHNEKTWWRNFAPGPHALRICLEGDWHDATASAISGETDPKRAAQLLDTFLRRFPKAVRVVPGDTRAENAASACLVEVTFAPS